MAKDLESIITFSLSVLGTGLGILNYWRDASKDKVRLKVIPKRVVASGSADPRINIGIEIINMSTFPLTICESGFVSREKKKRLAIIQPITANNETYPIRLEPRTAITIYAILEDVDAIMTECAYASTSCAMIYLVIALH